MGRHRKNIKTRLKSSIIRNLLMKSGISIKELAKRTGEIGRGKAISYKYINNLLSSEPKSIPSDDIVGKIATVLEVDPRQIAEGMDPPPDQVHETSVPYITNQQSYNVYQMIMIKAERAGLYEDEKQQLEEVINKIGDLLTSENREERKKYAAIIYGIIALCQTALFQQAGKEVLSSHSKKEKIK